MGVNEMRRKNNTVQICVVAAAPATPGVEGSMGEAPRCLHVYGSLAVNQDFLKRCETGC